MAIYTFSISEVAGMIARLDAEGGGGNVIVVGGTLRESELMLDALCDALPLGAAVITKQKTKGKRRFALASGLTVRAISGGGGRGKAARLGIIAPSVKPEVVRDAHLAVNASGGGLIGLSLPTTPPAPAPEHTAPPAPAPQPTEAPEAE